MSHQAIIALVLAATCFVSMFILAIKQYEKYIGDCIEALDKELFALSGEIAWVKASIAGKELDRDDATKASKIYYDRAKRFRQLGRAIQADAIEVLGDKEFNHAIACQFELDNLQVRLDNAIEQDRQLRAEGRIKYGLV